MNGPIDLKTYQQTRHMRTITTDHTKATHRPAHTNVGLDTMCNFLISTPSLDDGRVNERLCLARVHVLVA